MHRQGATDPAENAAEAEGDQPLPHHADADRARRHLVLAGRLQAIAARRPLVGQRQDDGGSRPECR